ncbi:MAG: hypothetical protein H7Y13_05320 [Sphingobacteriaceae bacterium]|nr:hypothetical protein [Sphingobacteriaceae bacterium]
MKTPKKKFDTDSTTDSEDPIADKPLLNDEDDDFDTSLDDLSGFEDLDSLDDDDDDDY